MTHIDQTQPVRADDHVQGADSAAVTLVEYGDYECPHCRIAHAVVGRLLRHFDGKLRFVYRNFPLSEIHDHAELAAVAAEAAGALGKFWPMHDLLFENQRALSRTDITGYAVQIGIPADVFLAELHKHALLQRVRADFESGLDSGVHGTPTFFINGRRHGGAPDYDTLRLVIEPLL
jgi:protein-disulfide isomerase